MMSCHSGNSTPQSWSYATPLMSSPVSQSADTERLHVIGVHDLAMLLYRTGSRV
jgi:hypothetical protein